MRNNSLFFVILAVLALFMNSQNVYSQSSGADEKKFEVGGQFSVLHTSIPDRVTFTGVVCVTVPCPSFLISGSRETQPGFGGRIGYNLTTNVALEAELNFFPGAGSFSVPGFNGGHKIQGLFGLKAGKRFDKVGIFGKARPGFLSASKGDLRPRPEALCLAVFPPSAGCFETTRKTSLAFDLGGVVEIYPTKRTIIRFDAGDTILRLGERGVPGVFNSPLAGLGPFVVIRTAETTHNFQGSIGIGFRF